MVGLRRFRSQITESVRKLVTGPNSTSSLMTAASANTVDGPLLLRTNVALNIDSTSQTQNSIKPMAQQLDQFAVANAMPSSTTNPSKPKFFVWTLKHHQNPKKQKDSANLLMERSMCSSQGTAASGGGSCGSTSPRTPDSSRSVSFDDAVTWPYIDDEEAEDSPAFLII